jgi:uncharacterized membrane protein YczE
MSEFEAYLRLGFSHITDPKGYDHILFVIALCTVYHLREWKRVLVLVTAFTIGHSITLALSTLHLVAFRTDIIEFLIPVTILLTALGNFFHQAPVHTYEKTPPPYTRYLSALLFGLIHGLGFSNYLKSLLGASANIVPQLLAFNIGLELGQILIVLFFLLLAWMATELLRVKRRDWNLVISGIVAGMALSLILGSELLG